MGLSDFIFKPSFFNVSWGSYYSLGQAELFLLHTNFYCNKNMKLV